MRYRNRNQVFIKSRLAVAAVLVLLSSSSAWAQSKGKNQSPLNTDSFQLADGFQAELVYEVEEPYGSWVSITTSPMGLITSDQYGKLYQVTPGDTPEETVVKPIPVAMGHAQGLLWAFDSLYVMAHARGKETPAGLYRVTDSNADGELDNVELLRKIDGGGEHGPHAIVLSPDKKSLYVCAGNHTRLTDLQTSAVPRTWREDNLLPRMWDPGGHAVGIMAPGGWVCKTDPEGKSWELISIGFRNQYDIAFNEQGDLFTYDADMEWDIGTPWYRPTRVCHVTPGSEFGWRGGDAKWPTYYPDGLPAVIDIGPGSPTGIVFGTGADFPQAYEQALFIADWSFGFIYAIHLKPEGGSYTAEKELFCSAPALQVTDMVVHDGDLYFAIGGRRTQSALFRIKAKPGVGEGETSIAKSESLHELRRDIEAGDTVGKLDNDADRIRWIWEQLGVPDRHVRYAARLQLEKYPLEIWQEQAFAEKNPQVALESLLALCRHADASASLQAKVVDAIEQNMEWENLDHMQKLHLLRVCGLLLMRLNGGDDNAAAKQRLAEKFTALYPADSVEINRELCRLLVACEADDVVAKTMDLIDSAGTQEEQIHYVMCLRAAKPGWTPALQRRFLEWFVKSAVFQGGRSFAGYLKNARDEFLATLSDSEKAALKDLIEMEMSEQDPYAELKSRPLVKNWQVDELLPVVDATDFSQRNLENGKRIFSMAQCYKCHQFAGSGGIVGPDLTGLSRRYTNQYLLETLIDPNKEISSQYQATLFELEDGRMITGRVANLNNNKYMVQEDMITPGKLTNVDRDAIMSSKPSSVSPMPEDLLDSFTQDEILDLLAYLRSADQ